MRWGCCTTIDNLSILERIGYDYVELTMVSIADSARYGEIRQAVAKSGLRAEAFNVLLPQEIKIVGPDVDWELIRKYIGTVFPRARALGGEVVVFGSGRSRRVPEGFPRDQAHRQAVDFVEFVGETGASHDLLIGIEPLRSMECNLINRIDEADRVAQEIDQASVGVLADFYHMMEGGEPLENIANCDSQLIHVHLADTGRLWPGSGAYDYDSFFNHLKQARYDGRMSLECSYDDFPENAKAALAFLKDKWHEA